MIRPLLSPLPRRPQRRSGLGRSRLGRSRLALPLAALLLGAAGAVPVKLGALPISVEPNPKLLTLTAAGIRTVFPSAAGRPDAVFMTEDRKVSVAFEWRQGKLAVNEISALTASFPGVIRAQVPGVKTLKSAVMQVGGAPWAQFIFTTPAAGDERRHEMMITSVGGRMLVVTVAGNVKDYSRNEAVVRGLVGSVRVLPQ